MKIGIMLRHIDQHGGGIRVYTQNLLRQMLALRSSHEFVLVYQNPELIGTYGDGERVREVSVRVPSPLLWDQLAVPWVERKEKLDVVFNPKFTIPFVSKAKKVFVFHGSEGFAIPDAYLWYDRWYIRTVAPIYARHADAIISVSHRVKDDVAKFTGVDPDKVFPIHNGYDPGTFHVIGDSNRQAAVRHEYQLPDQFILWTGQIYPPKNFGRLLKAFSQIKDELPHSLVIAGEERWRGKDDLRFVHELGIEGRVKFAGWVSHRDLPVLYNMADLFVLPSLHEGFGIPLLEAMASGCPVLTSTTCSPPEVVAGAGYLVNPLNVEEIANGIRNVLYDRLLRRAMVKKGLERVKFFSWDKCARETLNILEAAGA